LLNTEREMQGPATPDSVKQRSRLMLRDGRALTGDGHDVLRDAARRAGCLRSVA
jgi:hypothetical protein